MDEEEKKKAEAQAAEAATTAEGAGGGNRERYLARLKEKYPDKDFSDDEVLFGQVNDDYDNTEKELSGYKEREQKFSDLFTRDPRSASFLMNWRDGGDPAVELVRMFGEDFVDELQNPEKQEELAKASQEFAERVAKEKEFEEQYSQNIEQTLGVIEELQKETGRTDEEIDGAMSFLVGIMKDGILGKFSRESLEMAFKALEHDEDMVVAGQEGEVRGRNAKIVEKLRKGDKGDGTASLGGRNGGGERPTGPELGALGRYGDGGSIWTRGGEKRVRR